MEHECGDIIQPGDCVLLRAGSKKNELPYVAKVASLWENPEDGKLNITQFNEVDSKLQFLITNFYSIE